MSQAVATVAAGGERAAGPAGLSGAWPKSPVFWVVAGYMALHIIRPWEQLWPWLEIIRLERIYFVLMMVMVLMSGKAKVKMLRGTGTLLVFLVLMGLSTLASTNLEVSWQKYYLLITFTIYYLLLVTVIDSEVELAAAVTLYIGVMFAYLFKAQWEYFLNAAGHFDMGVHRMYGLENTYGYPNALAQAVVASLPLALWLWSRRAVVTGGWPARRRRWLSLFLVAYFYLAISSIALTNSRSGMIGFIAFMILSSFGGRGWAKKLAYFLLAVVFLAIVWSLTPEQTRGRFETLWNPEAGPETAQLSTMGRIEGFKAGLDIFRRHPLAGIGLGNFKDVRARQFDGSSLSPHNLLAEILSETGLAGAAGFLILILGILGPARSLGKLAAASPDARTGLLAGLGVACRNAIWLMLLAGLGGHNLIRYNWTWLAAFVHLGYDLARRRAAAAAARGRQKV